MKKRLASLTITLVLAMTLVSPAKAASDTGDYRIFAGMNEDYLCTATLIDPGKDGNLLLSISSVPNASIEIIDKISLVCNVANFFGAGSLFGCDYVDLGDKFYRHVDTLLEVDICLFDAKTGDFVWEGPMKDGDIIRLGNDHPSGYIIKCKPHFLSLPFVKLIVLDNLEVS